MKRQARYFSFIFLLFFGNAWAQTKDLHVISVTTPEELREFFAYSADRIPFISAHRGGASEGFPENCIATFENTLRHTHAIIEVDPRLTKDSVIVLMHDETVDRTTNGTGKVADYTWPELKKLRLRDPEGNTTRYRIPTLDEALEWARGKTILVLDKKSVPAALTERSIREKRAEACAMVIAYSYEEAKQYHDKNEDLMMEVFIPNRQRLFEFEKTDIPYENVVAFIAHVKPDDKSLYEDIHRKGMMCIVGSSRSYDKQFAAGDSLVYDAMVEEGVDIIEADRAIDAGKAIAHFRMNDSSKAGFFKIVRVKRSAIRNR